MSDTIGDVIVQSTDSKEQIPIYNFATVGNVYDDGLSLIFDGQENETEKHYKCNTSVLFKAGDRVKILQDSGTYVVEYVVGAPKQEDKPVSSGGNLPSGGSAGQYLKKSSAQDYDAAWETLSGLLPTGGSTGQTIVKSSSANYSCGWGNMENVDSVKNQYNTNKAYAIQFRTNGTSGSYSFQIRLGSSGTWKTITIT